jgi:hypothetical protein
MTVQIAAQDKDKASIVMSGDLPEVFGVRSRGKLVRSLDGATAAMMMELDASFPLVHGVKTIAHVSAPLQACRCAASHATAMVEGQSCGIDGSGCLSAAAIQEQQDAAAAKFSLSRLPMSVCPQTLVTGAKVSMTASAAVGNSSTVILTAGNKGTSSVALRSSCGNRRLNANCGLKLGAHQATGDVLVSASVLRGTKFSLFSKAALPLSGPPAASESACGAACACGSGTGCQVTPAASFSALPGQLAANAVFSASHHCAMANGSVSGKLTVPFSKKPAAISFSSVSGKSTCDLLMTPATGTVSCAIRRSLPDGIKVAITASGPCPLLAASHDATPTRVGFAIDM